MEKANWMPPIPSRTSATTSAGGPAASATGKCARENSTNAPTIVGPRPNRADARAAMAAPTTAAALPPARTTPRTGGDSPSPLWEVLVERAIAGRVAHQSKDAIAQSGPGRGQASVDGGRGHA